MTAHTASAINAYTVLVLGMIGIKMSFDKEVMDFVPVMLSVFLLILNNSIKYFNRTPAYVAYGITLLLIYFLSKELVSIWNTDEVFCKVRLTVMLVSSLPPLYFLIVLYKEKARVRAKAKRY